MSGETIMITFNVLSYWLEVDSQKGLSEPCSHTLQQRILINWDMIEKQRGYSLKRLSGIKLFIFQEYHKRSNSTSPASARAFSLVWLCSCCPHDWDSIHACNF